MIAYGHFVNGELQSIFENDDATLGLIEIPDWPGFDAAPSPYHRYFIAAGGGFEWRDTRTLDEAKQLRWEEVKAWRDSAEYGVLEWDGSRFNADERSQVRIMGAYQRAVAALTAGEDFEIEWTLADNSSRVLSGWEMLELGLALAMAAEDAHQVARDLRRQIDAATTVAEVDAVSWPVGAPPP